MRQGIRRGRGKFAGNAPDGIGRDAGDAGRPFGRVLADRCGKFVKTIRVFGNEMLVIQALRR